MTNKAINFRILARKKLENGKYFKKSSKMHSFRKNSTTQTTCERLESRDYSYLGLFYMVYLSDQGEKRKGKPPLRQTGWVYRAAASKGIYYNELFDYLNEFVLSTLAATDFKIADANASSSKTVKASIVLPAGEVIWSTLAAG